MVFYIIELDELLLVTIGSFFYKCGINNHDASTINYFRMPDKIKDMDDLSNYTLVYIGDI